MWLQNSRRAVLEQRAKILESLNGQLVLSLRSQAKKKRHKRPANRPMLT